MLLFYPDITGWFLQQPLQVRRWQCVQVQAALACKARDGRPRHLDMKDVSKQRIFSRYAICYPMLHPSGVAKSTHPSKSTSANKVLQRHAPNLMSSLAWHSHVEVSFRSALRSHGLFKSQTTIWPHALRHWWLRIQLIELFFRELEDVKLIGKLELFLLQNSWHFPYRHFPPGPSLSWIAAEKLGMAPKVHHISWSLAPVPALSSEHDLHDR